MADGHRSYTIQYDCGTGNDYNGRLGVRISSIFVIGFGSMIGTLHTGSGSSHGTYSGRDS